MRMWQDEWSLALGGKFEHRLFVETGAHAGFLAGIERRRVEGITRPIELIRNSVIDAERFARIEEKIPGTRLVR